MPKTKADKDQIAAALLDAIGSTLPGRRPKLKKASALSDVVEDHFTVPEISRVLRISRDKVRDLLKPYEREILTLSQRRRGIRPYRTRFVPKSVLAKVIADLKR